MTFTTPTECFPLAWPTGVPRRRLPERAPFGRDHTLASQIDEVYRQLRLMKADGAVVTSNLPRRADGTPRGDSTPRDNEHGVAIYWTTFAMRAGARVRVPHCMPCDRWDHIRHNMRAIALSLDAMRGLERWGAVSLEQAFAGFAALPPGDPAAARPAPAELPWRDVLGVEGAWVGGAPAAAVLAYAKTRHRELAKIHHPDRGGDTATAAAINRALEQAEAELGGGA